MTKKKQSSAQVQMLPMSAVEVNAGQSPYKMFEGIMTPNGKDENGDLIYFYTPKQ